jgi:hypothetical protein
MTMATEFIYFPKLPTEIRYKIWEFCMPDQRVMELDFFQSEEVGVTCAVGETAWTNSLPPTISKICRESRKIAFEQGNFLWEPLGAESLSNVPIWEFCVNPVPNPWFSPKRDIVQISWDSDYDGLYDVPRGGPNTYPVFIALAKMAQGASIMSSMLLPLQENDDYTDWHYWPKSKTKEWVFLRELKDCNVVLKVVSIHTTDKLVIDSGLFGSLETPVQLVSASEHKTIRRMYDLWRNTPPQMGDHSDNSLKRDTEAEKAFDELINTQDAWGSRVNKWKVELEQAWLWDEWCIKRSEESLDTINAPANLWACGIQPGMHPGIHTLGPDRRRAYVAAHEFDRTHSWVKEVLDNMPKFRPVVMFRYCTYECHLKEWKSIY